MEWSKWCYLNSSWNATEKSAPKAIVSLKGDTIMYKIEENNSASSQKKPLATNIIVLTGSFAIVRINIASGGPNAIIPHPKNWETVIFLFN